MISRAGLVLRADLIGLVNAARAARENPRDAGLLLLVIVGTPLFFAALWFDIRLNAEQIAALWPQFKYAGFGGTAFFGLMRGFRVLPLALDKAFGGWLAVLPVTFGERLAAAIVAATSQIAFWAAPFALTGFIIGYETGVWPAGAIALSAAGAYGLGIASGYVIALLVATRPWQSDGDGPPSAIALAARMRFKARRRGIAPARSGLGGRIGHLFDMVDRASPRWIAHWAWGDDRLRNGLITLAVGLAFSQGWATFSMIRRGSADDLPLVAAGFAHMAFIVACLAKPAGIAAFRVSGLGFGRATLGVARLGIIISVAVYGPLALLAIAIDPVQAPATAIVDLAGLCVLDVLYLFSAMRRPASAVAGILGYLGGLTVTGVAIGVFGFWGAVAMPLYVYLQARVARRRFRGHVI